MKRKRTVRAGLEARNYPRLSTRQREVRLAAYRDKITKRNLFDVNRFLEQVRF